jgi:hypothetical protein
MPSASPYGRGKDKHVDLDDLVAADALDLALLEHAKDFRLRGKREVADFVEEYRAFVGHLELAFFFA